MAEKNPVVKKEEAKERLLQEGQLLDNFEQQIEDTTSALEKRIKEDQEELIALYDRGEAVEQLIQTDLDLSNREQKELGVAGLMRKWNDFKRDTERALTALGDANLQSIDDLRDNVVARANAIEQAKNIELSNQVGSVITFSSTTEARIINAQGIPDKDDKKRSFLSGVNLKVTAYDRNLGVYTCDNDAGEAVFINAEDLQDIIERNEATHEIATREHATSSRFEFEHDHGDFRRKDVVIVKSFVPDFHGEGPHYIVRRENTDTDIPVKETALLDWVSMDIAKAQVSEGATRGLLAGSEAGYLGRQIEGMDHKKRELAEAMVALIENGDRNVLEDYIENMLAEYELPKNILTQVKEQVVSQLEAEIEIKIQERCQANTMWEAIGRSGAWTGGALGIVLGGAAFGGVGIIGTVGIFGAMRIGRSLHTRHARKKAGQEGGIEELRDDARQDLAQGTFWQRAKRRVPFFGKGERALEQHQESLITGSELAALVANATRTVTNDRIQEMRANFMRNPEASDTVTDLLPEYLDAADKYLDEALHIPEGSMRDRMARALALSQLREEQMKAVAQSDIENAAAGKGILQKKGEQLYNVYTKIVYGSGLAERAQKAGGFRDALYLSGAYAGVGALVTGGIHATAWLSADAVPVVRGVMGVMGGIGLGKLMSDLLDRRSRAKAMRRLNKVLKEVSDDLRDLEAVEGNELDDDELEQLSRDDQSLRAIQEATMSTGANQLGIDMRTREQVMSIRARIEKVRARDWQKKKGKARALAVLKQMQDTRERVLDEAAFDKNVNQVLRDLQGNTLWQKAMKKGVFTGAIIAGGVLGHEAQSLAQDLHEMRHDWSLEASIPDVFDDSTRRDIVTELSLYEQATLADVPQVIEGNGWFLIRTEGTSEWSLVNGVYRPEAIDKMSLDVATTFHYNEKGLWEVGGDFGEVSSVEVAPDAESPKPDEVPGDGTMPDVAMETATGEFVVNGVAYNYSYEGQPVVHAGGNNYFIVNNDGEMIGQIGEEELDKIIDHRSATPGTTRVDHGRDPTGRGRARSERMPGAPDRDAARVTPPEFVDESTATVYDYALDGEPVALGDSGERDFHYIEDDGSLGDPVSSGKIRNIEVRPGATVSVIPEKVALPEFVTLETPLDTDMVATITDADQVSFKIGTLNYHFNETRPGQYAILVEGSRAGVTRADVLHEIAIPNVGEVSRNFAQVNVTAGMLEPQMRPLFELNVLAEQMQSAGLEGTPQYAQLQAQISERAHDLESQYGPILDPRKIDGFERGVPPRHMLPLGEHHEPSTVPQPTTLPEDAARGHESAPGLSDAHYSVEYLSRLDMRELRELMQTSKTDLLAAMNSEYPDPDAIADLIEKRDTLVNHYGQHTNTDMSRGAFNGITDRDLIPFMRHLEELNQNHFDEIMQRGEGTALMTGLESSAPRSAAAVDQQWEHVQRVIVSRSDGTVDLARRNFLGREPVVDRAPVPSFAKDAAAWRTYYGFEEPDSSALIETFSTQDVDIDQYYQELNDLNLDRLAVLARQSESELLAIANDPNASPGVVFRALQVRSAIVAAYNEQTVALHPDRVREFGMEDYHRGRSMIGPDGQGLELGFQHFSTGKDIGQGGWIQRRFIRTLIERCEESRATPADPWQNIRVALEKTGRLWDPTRLTRP